MVYFATCVARLAIKLYFNWLKVPFIIIGTLLAYCFMKSDFQEKENERI